MDIACSTFPLWLALVLQYMSGVGRRNAADLAFVNTDDVHGYTAMQI